MAGSGSPGRAKSSECRRRNLVDHDLSVESCRQLYARRLSLDPIDRRSWIQEGSVAIFQPVAGVADVAAHLELHTCVDRAEVALLNGGRRRRRSNVLRRADLDEVDPIDLRVAAGGRAWQLACTHQQEASERDYEPGHHYRNASRPDL